MESQTQVMVMGEGTDDYVQLWPAGTSVKGEFNCAQCGYGAIVSTQLPTCPMCSGDSWEQVSWSPFARAGSL